MKKIKNYVLKGTKVITTLGEAIFNQNGIAEVDDEVADTLLTLKGYTEADENAAENGENAPKQVDTQGEPETAADAEESPSEDTEPEATEGEEAEVVASYTEDELNALTVPALKKIAVDAGLDVTGKSKKVEFIELILGSAAEAADAE